MLNLLHTFSEFEKFITHFLHKNKILDKELHTFLKANKKIGSKDRKLLSEIIFHYYRNYIKIQFLSNEFDFLPNINIDLDTDLEINKEINKNINKNINNLNLKLFIITLFDLNYNSEFFIQIERKYTFWKFNENIEKLVLYFYPNLEKQKLKILNNNFSNYNIDIDNKELRFSFPQFLIKSISRNLEHIYINSNDDLISNTLSMLNKKANVYIRIVKNIDEIENEFSLNEVNMTKTLLPHCYQLNFEGNIKLTDFITYQKGYFEIQDIGSQLTYFFTEKYFNSLHSNSLHSNSLIQKSKHFKILDLCAGGGGKSLLWADNIQNDLNNTKDSKSTNSINITDTTYHIFSSDITNDRLKGLNERLNKNSKIKRNITTQIINHQNTNFHNLFDLLIIDAPCSGIGTCRRDVNLKLRITDEDLIKYKSTQISLIEKNYVLLKNGGLLIYITCSLSFEENNGVVNEILEKLKGKIKPVNIFDYLNENIKNEIINVYKDYNNKINKNNILSNDSNYDLITKSNHFTILPQYFNSDGFFVALFEK